MKNIKRTPTYTSWLKMRERCNNPNGNRSKFYFEKGITYCKEWDNYANFLLDMGERPEKTSLDRIDNNKGYSPDNCRWANAYIQGTNQRMKKSNTSGFVGIIKSKSSGRWRARVSTKYTSKHIGCFNTIEEAVLARDNYIIENKLPHKLSTDYKKEN